MHVISQFVFWPFFLVPHTGIADQLAQAVGLPDVFLSAGEGGGIIQGSASDSTLVALLSARARAFTYMRRVNPGASDHELMAKMTLYASDQVSEPTRKAKRPYCTASALST